MKEPALFKDLAQLKTEHPPVVVRALAGKTQFHFEELGQSFKHDSTHSPQHFEYTLHANEGSQLEVVLFQNARLDSDLLTTINVTADQNANVKLTFIQEGAERSEVQISTQCLGKGASIDIHGLQNAKLKQKLSFKMNAVHAVPHTTSDLKVWCVARDESQSIFNALVTIEKGAHHTEAYQRNKNLLLSEKATIDTFPKLFIGNDDVKCAHGSSTSTLDDDQFYYLQSRGISPSEAEQMLVKGFLAQALEWISDEKTSQVLRQALHIQEEDFS